MADGSVVDGARFSQLVRSNPSYYETKLITGDTGRLSNSGTNNYVSSSAYPSNNYVISGGGSYHTGGYDDLRPR